jgi:hypothetical protein
MTGELRRTVPGLTIPTAIDGLFMSFLSWMIPDSNSSRRTNRTIKNPQLRVLKYVMVSQRRYMEVSPDCERRSGFSSNERNGENH